MAKKPKPSAPAPVPAPSGYILDSNLNGRLNSLSTVNCSVAFDTLANVNNYVLYYEQDPQPSGIYNGVTIDGKWYRQVTSGYPTSPFWVYFGWSPMYIGAQYKCRIGVYFNDGTYAYSLPFTISTAI